MISLVMPWILMSICSGSCRSVGAGHLEVHVAEVIFVTQNVGQHGEAASFLIRPMAMPATGAFERNPRPSGRASRRRTRPSTTNRSTQ